MIGAFAGYWNDTISESLSLHFEIVVDNLPSEHAIGMLANALSN